MSYLNEQIDELNAVEFIFDNFERQSTDEEKKMFKFSHRLNGQPRETPSVDLHIRFPPGYPYEQSLEIIALSGFPSSNNESPSEVLTNLRSICKQNTGAPSLYDVLSELKNRIDQILPAERQNVLNKSKSAVEKEASSFLPEKEIKIFHGESIVDRKSVFQAHVVAVKSVSEFQVAHEQIVTDRKVSSALHNIYAYRILTTKDNIIEDNEDDGEHGAGSRLAHLLHIMDVRNVLVVVTRWYGGIHLGPDRFKHINNCARKALIDAGFVSDANK